MKQEVVQFRDWYGGYAKDLAYFETWPETDEHMLKKADERNTEIHYNIKRNSMIINPKRRKKLADIIKPLIQ